MDGSTVQQWVAGGLLVVGVLLCLAAGVGILRFPDALARLHAMTKPQILGLACVLGALAVSQGQWTTLLALVPVLVFQMFTAPVAAHMIARAGYRAGDVDRELLLVDEYADRAAEGDRRG